MANAKKILFLSKITLKMTISRIFLLFGEVQVRIGPIDALRGVMGRIIEFPKSHLSLLFIPFRLPFRCLCCF